MLFNQYRTSPQEVISLFEKDIEFLENLYLWFEENDNNHDYDGKYLLALYRNNNAFLTKYIHKVYEITPKYKLDDRFRKCRVFLIATIIKKYLISLPTRFSRYLSSTSARSRMLSNASQSKHRGKMCERKNQNLGFCNTSRIILGIKCECNAYLRLVQILM